MWITFHKKDASGNGYYIGRYNFFSKKWEETPDQPVGADYGFDSLAVDSEGDPAYIGFKSKHILFMKGGMWTEVGGCSFGVAFGPKGQLFRRGCDSHVYQYIKNQAEWVRLGDNKALALSASETGVWITDKVKMTTFKWNEKKKKFEGMGAIRAADIAVGMKSQVVVRNWENDTIYTLEGKGK